MKTLLFAFFSAGLAGAALAAPVDNVTANPNTGELVGPATLWTANAADIAAALSLSTTYQPLDADLTAIAGLATTGTGRSLLTAASLTPTGMGMTVTKSDVGLGSADNTSDLDKPISTATQAALDLKAPLASPTFTGVPEAPTASADTSTSQLATTAFAKAEADAAQAASQPLDTNLTRYSRSLTFQLSRSREAITQQGNFQAPRLFKWVWSGDSLGGQFSTYLTAFSPGYNGASDTGQITGVLAMRYGYAGAGIDGLKTTLAGDAVSASDFTIWITGRVYSIGTSGSSGSVTFSNYADDAFVPADRFSVYVIHESGAGHYKVQYQEAGGAWTDYTGMEDIDADNAGAAAIVVQTGVLAGRGTYKIRVVPVSGATVRTAGAYLRDQTSRGVVNLPINLSGISVDSSITCSQTSLNTVLTDIDADGVSLAYDDNPGTAAYETLINMWKNATDFGDDGDIVVIGNWEPASSPSTVRANNLLRRTQAIALGVNFWEPSAPFGGGPYADAGGQLDGDSTHWAWQARRAAAYQFAADAGWLEVPDRYRSLRVVKYRDESRAGTTTAADDSALVQYVEPGTYNFRAFLLFSVTSGTAGIRVGVSPTATTADSSFHVTIPSNTGASAFQRNSWTNSGNTQSISLGPSTINGGGNLPAWVDWTFRVTARGTVAVKWAQGASDGSNATTVHKGSWMVVEKLD